MNKYISGDENRWCHEVNILSILCDGIDQIECLDTNETKNGDCFRDKNPRDSNSNDGIFGEHIDPERSDHP